jgi:hypothetical protein
MDWLFGPRERGMTGGSQTFLRSMALDIEALSDVVRDLSDAARKEVSELGRNPTVTATYWIDTQEIPEAQVKSLSTADKDRLELRFQASGGPAGGSPSTVSISAQSRDASVSVVAGPEVAGAAARMRKTAIDTLYRLGDSRVTRTWLTRLLPLLPPAIAAVAWVWLALTSSVPLAAHVLLATAWVPAALWAAGTVRRRTIEFQISMAASLRYRGESRTETSRRRADRQANRRVATVTAILTLLITLAGAFATAYFTGWFSGSENCENVVDRVSSTLSDDERRDLLAECAG